MPEPSKSTRPFTVVSLFSGGLGLDAGLERTRHFTLLACVEKAPAFCDTIRRNRDAGRIGTPETRVYEMDIGDLDPATVLRAGEHASPILSKLGVPRGRV